jgi:hypothetical protein
MKQLGHEQQFGGYKAQRIFTAEVGNGTVVLQWQKLNGSFSTQETFTEDTLKVINTAEGLMYRVVLTGTATASISL